MKKTLMVTTMVVALILSVVGAAAAQHVVFDDLESQSTAGGWQQNRTWPTGGVELLETFEGSSNVAKYTLDSGQVADNEHNRTEGLARNLEAGVTEVSVDLYLDPEWEDSSLAVRAGIWGREADVVSYPVLEFARNADHIGIRYWESGFPEGRGWVAGHTLGDLGLTYGDWVTLTIVDDQGQGRFTYLVNGTPVGGSTFAGAGGLDQVMLGSRNYGHDDDDQGDEFDHGSYSVHYRGLNTDSLWEGATTITSDSLNVAVTYEPLLLAEMTLTGTPALDVDEFGEYTATVTNTGTERDLTIENWNLGLEVAQLTSVNELTLEFCQDDSFDETVCADVADLPDVQLELVDGVVQVLGSSEAPIAPGWSETFHFRAAFANEGEFTGTVYALHLDD